MLISASDDKTKQSADLFLQKILDGEFSIIGENAFFKGVKYADSPDNEQRLYNTAYRNDTVLQSKPVQRTGSERQL